MRPRATTGHRAAIALSFLLASCGAAASDASDPTLPERPSPTAAPPGQPVASTEPDVTPPDDGTTPADDESGLEVIAEIDDPNGAGAIFAPRESMLDPLLLGPDDVPDGSNFDVDNAYSGIEGDPACTPSVDHAAVEDWMVRESTFTTASGDAVEQRVGIIPFGVDGDEALRNIARFAECDNIDGSSPADFGLTSSRVETVAPASEAAMFSIDSIEGRGTWIMATLPDQIIVSVAILGPDATPSEAERILQLVIAKADEGAARREGCLATRTVTAESQTSAAATPLELCGDFDEWHLEVNLLPLVHADG